VNVYDKIDNKTVPTLPKDRIFKYNIILDWPQAAPVRDAETSKK
jgi:hypothetical protein